MSQGGPTKGGEESEDDEEEDEDEAIEGRETPVVDGIGASVEGAGSEVTVAGGSCSTETEA